LKIGAEVVPFIEDMAAAMARADLVVCRSGAGTVAELAVIGRPAVFVPLPTAADDHQRKNAIAVSSRGAGICVDEASMNEGVLGDALVDLLRDRGAIETMSRRSRELGRPSASQNIADEMIELSKRG
jgi:UDP-N-acetylglucosamine--N-acetylmuramyl-(pentapeptide) pyrophosphoryl-undecaprenol N-acetylglucosamine transferase